MEKAISKARRELETTERKREEAEHRRKLLGEELQSLELQIERKTIVREDIDRSIELAKSRMDDEIGRHKQVLEEAYSKLKRGMIADYNKNQTLQSKITVLEEKKQTLHQEIQELKEKFNKRKDELKSEVQALQEEINTLQQKVEDLKEEKKEIEAEIVKTEAEINRLEKDIKSREPLAKLAALLGDPGASLKRENLEPLLIVLKNIVRFSGLGPLWRASGKVRNIELIDELVKVLGEEIRRE